MARKHLATSIKTKGACVLAAYSFAALLAAAPASAGRLDQKQAEGAIAPIRISSQGDIVAAQIFTAGLSGPLDQVDLLLSRSEGCADPLIVEIRAAKGFPRDTRASTTIPPTAMPVGQPGFVPAYFDKTATARVRAGVQYAIVASAPPGSTCGYLWAGTDGDPYPRGHGAARFQGSWSFLVYTEGWDFAFLTYVVGRLGRCGGRDATLTGTAGRDRIRGTSDDDVIAGLGGRDSIQGLGGKDVICGGSGKDILEGGKGRDTCEGGKGRDVEKSC